MTPSSSLSLRGTGRLMWSAQSRVFTKVQNTLRMSRNSPASDTGLAEASLWDPGCLTPGSCGDVGWDDETLLKMEQNP